MNRQELAEQLAKAGYMPISTALKTVDTIGQLIAEALKEGDHVSLPHLGTFTTKMRQERVGRNFGTGESVTIPARRVVRFSSCKQLRDSLAEYSDADLDLVADLKDACFDIIVGRPGIKQAEWIEAVVRACSMEMVDAGITPADLPQGWTQKRYRDSILGWDKTFAEWSVAMGSYLEHTMGKT